MVANIVTTIYLVIFQTCVRPSEAIFCIFIILIQGRLICLHSKLESCELGTVAHLIIRIIFLIKIFII